MKHEFLQHIYFIYFFFSPDQIGSDSSLSVVTASEYQKLPKTTTIGSFGLGDSENLKNKQRIRHPVPSPLRYLQLPASK